MEPPSTLKAFDADTGNMISSTSTEFGDVYSMKFIGSDTLLIYGNGFARYNISGSVAAPACSTGEDYALWGFDAMLARDGERFVHSGSATTFVRNVSDCSVIAEGVPSAEIYNFGSIAAGPDGTYLLSYGLDGGFFGSSDFSIHVGRQDTNFTIVACIEVRGVVVSASGQPYEARDVTTISPTATTTTTTTTTTTAAAVGCCLSQTLLRTSLH